MPPGEMQILIGGFLQVAMPQQHLDGSQVGTGFEQMRGKAVAQGVGDGCACAQDRRVRAAWLTGGPEDLGGNRIVCPPYAIGCPGEQPVGGLAFQPAPVDAQRIEHGLGLSSTSRSLRPLPPPDMNDHPLAVNIADLQVRHFCATCARGIEGHQQNAIEKGKLRRVDQTCDLVLAEHMRQV